MDALLSLFVVAAGAIACLAAFSRPTLFAKLHWPMFTAAAALYGAALSWNASSRAIVSRLSGELEMHEVERLRSIIEAVRITEAVCHLPLLLLLGIAALARLPPVRAARKT